MATNALQIDENELEERGFVRLPHLACATDLDEFEQVIKELCQSEITRRGIKPSHLDPFVDVMLADEGYRNYLFPLLRRFHIVERISAEVGNRLAAAGFLRQHDYRAPMIWPYLRADLPHERT